MTRTTIDDLLKAVRNVTTLTETVATQERAISRLTDRLAAMETRLTALETGGKP